MSGAPRSRELAKAAVEDAADGRWVEPRVSYIFPARRFCAYCGRPIARRFWERSGEVYCDPEHGNRTTYPRSTNDLA